MSNKQSRIQKINPTYLIPQIAVALLIIFILRMLNQPAYFLVGIAFYFLLASYLKIIIPRSHRHGIRFVRKKKFEGAAFAFIASYAFFKKYAWLDKNRAYFLLSISAISYTEMALANAAYCLRVAGKNTEAKKFEDRLRSDYPNSLLLKR